jgi:uncharacterized damage-inducible protein DinB
MIMAKRNPSAEVKALLRLLDEAYERKAWHGPNLRGSLRGVSAGQAAWRPGRGRHNIWELALHAAYWKYAVERRIAGGKRGSFPVKGSNWFKVPPRPTDRAWRETVALLALSQKSLRKAVASLSNRDLKQVPKGSTVRNAATITGVAFHDVYHAGQIQLLKRLSQR